MLLKITLFLFYTMSSFTSSVYGAENTDAASTRAIFGDTPAIQSPAAQQQQQVKFAPETPSGAKTSSAGAASKWNMRKPFRGPPVSASSRADDEVPVPTPRSATFSHRSGTSATSTISQAVTGPPRHPERFPGQFLQPRFKNGVIRDLATAAVEFEGTLVFLLTAFLGSRLNASDLEVALGFAMGLHSTIFMHSSSQANPSITAMQLMLGKLSVRQAGFNVVAQVGASITASGIVKLMTDQVRSSVSLAQGISPARGLLIETVLSTILFTTVLYASALPSVKQSTAPFMISLIFLGLEVVGIDATGASLNIARFLGPRVIGGKWTVDDWVWAVGPAIAAPLSVLIFKANQLVQSPEAEHGDIGPSQLVEGRTRAITGVDDGAPRFFRQRPARAQGEEITEV